jgi:hypothetical protein
MKKVLIKILRTYQVKNKLQKAILENLQELDATLTDNKQAVGLIKIAYKDAINNYNGSAAVPELRNFEASDDTTVYYIEDVIYINVYKVIQDLT